MSDRLTSAINDRLPQWAKYEGYGTYALALTVFVAVMAGATVLSAVFWGRTQAAVFAVAGLIGLSLAGYFRDAAKLRVRCSRCQRPARGNDICPHCGCKTYMRPSEIQ